MSLIVDRMTTAFLFYPYFTIYLQIRKQWDAYFLKVDWKVIFYAKKDGKQINPNKYTIAL
ncbi:hypothetical protein AO843_03100 [Lysinibacillus sp. ZYM-1]|nr:hypothetical protein AO843_03100 [Lysinibacillus sp. ZYM-1]